MSYINSYCHISENEFYVNGKKIKSFKSESAAQFYKELYQFLEIDYPKFYKMDDLAKIGFLGTEILKKDFPKISDFKENEIALLFSNNNSSAVTDINFQESYSGGKSPSPALFVYTLPNILLGEIAIRNKWFGENMFTISEYFDADYFTNYGDILLNKNAKVALCGWINTNNDKTEAFLFFVTKKDIKNLNLPLNSKTLKKLLNINKN